MKNLNFEKLGNQLYFAFASMLFLLAAYQVDLSRRELIKYDKKIPRLRIESFKAGCQTALKAKCSKEEVHRYEMDMYRIYE